MFDYIKGILDNLTPTAAVVEAGGVGYLLQISMQTYAALEGQREVRVYVHQSVREDADRKSVV